MTSANFFENFNDELRPYMADVFRYGCYGDERYLPLLSNKKSETVYKKLPKISDAVGNDVFAHAGRGAGKNSGSFRFQYDRYSHDINYLVKLYQHRAFQSRNALPCMLLILQYAYEMCDENDDELITFGSFISTSEVDYNIIFDEDTINNYFSNVFSQNGVLIKEKKGQYRLAYNPLDVFVDDDYALEELKEVYDALELYSYRAPVKTPVNMAMETLRRYIYWKTSRRVKPKRIMGCEYNYIFTVLDDECSLDLTEAIQKKSFLKCFKYMQTDYTYIYPIKLVTETRYGRQYLIAIEWDGTFSDSVISSIRIDKIHRVENLAEEEKSMAPNFESFEERIDKAMELLDRSFTVEASDIDNIITIRFEKEYGGRNIYQEVLEDLHGGELVSEDDDSFVVALRVSRVDGLKPWLRQFGRAFSVVEDSEDAKKLALQIKNSLNLMRKNYGIVSD
ncbi:MAG: WYL domain-containing protein [Lachnospiraceae bacterium]|jgi:hypothetical protein|nr:WYL domain-containing protein [Lachnospiraceae bacterium]